MALDSAGFSRSSSEKQPRIRSVNYVVLIVVALWLFFSHLVWLLNWLYRSWLAAAVVVLLILVLLFHTERHFFDPSSFVLRYPLLTVCAALLTRWVAAPRDWTRLLPLAFALSLAVFIETETGAVIAVSTVLSFLLVSPFGVSSLRFDSRRWCIKLCFSGCADPDCLRTTSPDSSVRNRVDRAADHLWRCRIWRLAHCVDAAGMELVLQYGCARSSPRNDRHHASNCRAASWSTSRAPHCSCFSRHAGF